MLTAIALALLLFPAMIVWMIVDNPHNLSEILRGAGRRGPRGRKGIFEELARQAELERTGRIDEDPIDPAQAEIARKCAIADQAIAARARGETFVPPADYDR